MLVDRQVGWYRCHGPVASQVRGLVGELHSTLGDNLVGVYLHGSLAMGCHNPAMSDVDLLAVTERPMGAETKRDVAEMLLERSMSPNGIEISFLTREHLTPWRHPAPFDFHYGEMDRGRIEAEMAGDAWRQWDAAACTDPDLAAHITALRERGLVLWGETIPRVFPPVPRDDYLDSLMSDIDWTMDRFHELPFWSPVLNFCRVLAYLRIGGVMSKAEGARWGLEELPEELHAVIVAAKKAYCGTDPDADYEHAALQAFADRLFAMIRAEKAGRKFS